MESKPEPTLSRELIYKSMMQLDLLKTRCDRMPKSPEVSANTEVNTYNIQCQCVNSKLQTDLCRRLSEDQFLLNYVENKICQILDMADPSTSNNRKVESNSGTT